MKSLLALFLVSFSLSTANALAAAADCAKEKTSKISAKCRAEVAQSMDEDALTLAMRSALESAYPLRACRTEDPAKMRIRYVVDEATGPKLEASTFLACESDDDADGYEVKGEYFLGTGGFRFRQLTLSSAE